MSFWVWIVIAILILANTFYVAAEFAAVGVRRSRVHRLADDGHWLARRLLPYVEHPSELDRYVGACQIGITLSSLMLGGYGQATLTPALSALLTGQLGVESLTALSSAALIVLVLLTALQLVLGELVPKSVALQYPTETALATVLPMRWSLAAFNPLISLLNGAALRLLRAVGAEHGHAHLHSPDEIDLLIAESRDGGLLEAEEQQRLRRALRLGLRSARDLMVPLDRVTMVSRDASWDEVMRIVSASPFSRLPVFAGDRTRIVGILRVKDLADRYVVQGPVPVATLMRPVSTLAADTPADQALAFLREGRMQSAILTGADGIPAGLITVQDVLNELLGEPG